MRHGCWIVILWNPTKRGVQYDNLLFLRKTFSKAQRWCRVQRHISVTVSGLELCNRRSLGREGGQPPPKEAVLWANNQARDPTYQKLACFTEWLECLVQWLIWLPAA